MKDIGFGILGFGRQGFRLAQYIINNVPHGKLIAVCRRSTINTDYLAQHHIKFYPYYHELFKNKDIHAIIITTPSGLHGIHAIKALEAKKHVLIDKPIASSVKEGQKILSLARNQNLTVAVNFPLRVNPVTKTLKDNLTKIGKLKAIQVFVSHGPIRNEWQNDPKLSIGGVIIDLGSHYFDLISFLTGQLPEMVNSAYIEETKNENSGFVNLIYKDFNASIVLLRNQKLKRSIVTCAGDKGSLSADYVGRKVMLSNDREINEIECPIGYDFAVLLNNLVQAINNKEKIIADAEAGLNALKIALSIYNVIKTNKPAKL